MIPLLHLLHLLFVSLLLCVVVTALPTSPEYDNCPRQTFDLTIERDGTTPPLTGTIKPRRVEINVTFIFVPDTQIKSGLNFTLESSATATSLDMPLSQYIVQERSGTTSGASTSFTDYSKRATGTAKIVIRIPIRTVAGSEQDSYNALKKRKMTFDFVNGICGRLLKVSEVTVGFLQQQAVLYLGTNGRLGPNGYWNARNWCLNKGAYLPTFVKDGELNYWRNSIWNMYSGSNQWWLGNWMVDKRPAYGVMCWYGDPDYDESLCTTSAANQYFSILRSKVQGWFECKTPLGCNSLNVDTGSADYDSQAAGTGYNFSIRWMETYPKMMDSGWKKGPPTEDLNNRANIVQYVCAQMATYKTLKTTLLSFDRVYTKSKSWSASFTEIQSATGNHSTATVSATQAETPSVPASASLTVSHSSSITQTQPPPRTRTRTNTSIPDRDPTASRSETPSGMQSESVARTVSGPPPTASQPLTVSQLVTVSGAPASATLSRDGGESLSKSESLPLTASASLPPSSTRTFRRTHSRDVASLSGSLTETPTETRTRPYFPPPEPTAAPPIPVAEQALIATTSAIAAAIAAPAAAQTLRTLSVIAIVDTNERCKLTRLGKDKFPSEPPQFPESLLPAIRLPMPGANETQDAQFALPWRRGVVIANAIVCPLCVGLLALLSGALRRHVISKKAYGKQTLITAGRVPGIVAAVVGAMAMDGLVGNCVILCSVPGGPNAGDICLALFGVLLGLSIAIVPGIVLYRRIEEENAAGRWVECVPAVLQKKKGEPGAPADGPWWFAFGTETYTGALDVVEQYRTLFSTSRGPSRFHEREWRERLEKKHGKKNEGAVAWRLSWLIWRRRASKWSFYLDCLLTGLAAALRGWATTRPCDANRKVQICMLCIALVAFLFACIVRPPISPMRRLADISAGFLMGLATFVLVMLGAESAVLVRRCSLASAFLMTSSAMALFIFRRVVLVCRGWKIQPAPTSKHFGLQSSSGGGAEDGGGDGIMDLADLLLMPFLGGEEDGDADAMNGREMSPRGGGDGDDNMHREVEMLLGRTLPPSAAAAAAADTQQARTESSGSESSGGQQQLQVAASINIGAAGNDDEEEIDLSEFLQQQQDHDAGGVVGEAEGRLGPEMNFSAYLQDAVDGGNNNNNEIEEEEEELDLSILHEN